METRSLRVVKWLTATPAVAECTRCQRQFSVPLPMLRRVSDAQENLRKQFAEHQCVAREEEQQD